MTRTPVKVLALNAMRSGIAISIGAIDGFMALAAMIAWLSRKD
jgi:hypothetical protein